MRPRGIGRLCLVLACAGILTGCHKKYEPVSVAISQEEETISTAEEESFTITTETEEGVPESDENLPPYYTIEERQEENGKIRSYLTGQMVDSSKGNRRPVAVMMSNDKTALPQYGINRADIVYEAPTEGNMNRYMAIFEDYDDLERIVSVRSCPTYYIYYAREFQAVLSHYGQSTFSKPYLKHIDDINGLESIGATAFYRSKDRKAPHNAYTSGGRINQSIEALGFDKNYGDDYQGHYFFARDGREVTLEGAPSVMEAWKVVPGYSLNNPWFEYNPEDGLYYRYQYGGPHQGDEGQIAVKNIILQYCPTGHYATTEYLDINVRDDSYGCFITAGKAIPVQWKKDGEFGVTHYYDMENNEIILNQGKTWVCVIPAQDSPKVEIRGRQS